MGQFKLKGIGKILFSVLPTLQAGEVSWTGSEKQNYFMPLSTQGLQLKELVTQLWEWS